MDDQLLLKIRQLIETNLSNEDYTVEHLAEDVGLSRSMLHRKLVRLTGKSANKLITEARLLKARELLENKAATASEIAYLVGFSDPSYFTKVFKKHFQVLPGDVKKNYTGPQDEKAETDVHELPELKRPKPHRLYSRIIIAVLIIGVSGFGVYQFFHRTGDTEYSIAVLPLDNLTGVSDNAYFVQGMHDALIGELGQIASLRVISRTSTLRYGESNMLLKDIADELGVNTIIEGSVIGAGDSLKLLIQLIKVFPEERHLLVNEYQDDMHHVLSVQKRAVRDIAQNIKISLSDEEKQMLTDPRTVNPETYKDYLRGMYFINQGTAESFEAGIECMKRAIDRDPADPLAYAGLAIAYAIKGHGMIASEGSFRSATAAAEKALRIDPTLDEAYAALAMLYTYQGWNWPKVQRAFENALKNNPNNALAHAHYAFYFVHFDAKEQALIHANRAIELEPLSAAYHAWLAWIYHYYGDYENAERMARRSLELKEDNPYGNLILGWINVHQKKYDQAIELHKKLPDYGDYYKMLIGYTYIQSGQREKALELFQEMERKSLTHFVNPFHRGMLAGMLGFTDRAFELFHEACDHKYYPIAWIDIFPGIEALKEDPRYAALLRRMNLPYNKTQLAIQDAQD